MLALSVLTLGACSSEPTPKSLIPPIAGIPTRDAPTCLITRVVDGDTIALTCGGGDPVSARLVGFDTPESHRPGCLKEEVAAQVAKDLLTKALTQASVIAPRSHGHDRYGRMLVSLKLDGQDLAETMTNTGFAVPYEGGRRIDWCARL